jgi:ribosomal-protein-alanine N-acetyltransferase
MLKEIPEITTQRLLLRPLELADAPDIQNLAADRDVASTTESIPHPYLKGMAESWVESSRRKFQRGELVNFAITLISDGAFIGAIGLRIDAENNEAEVGYWLGKPYWGQGYATEAAAPVIQYAFWELGLDRVRAFHFTQNPASGRVLEKVGMAYKGRLNQAQEKWGELVDLEEYEILKSDLGAAATGT